jgi:hypothetical protein
MVKLEPIVNQKTIVVNNKISEKIQNENYTKISYRIIKYRYEKSDKEEFDKQFPDDLAYGIRC